MLLTTLLHMNTFSYVMGFTNVIYYFTGQWKCNHQHQRRGACEGTRIPHGADGISWSTTWGLLLSASFNLWYQGNNTVRLLVIVLVYGAWLKFTSMKCILWTLLIQISDTAIRYKHYMSVIFVIPKCFLGSLFSILFKKII